MWLFIVGCAKLPEQDPAEAARPRVPSPTSAMYVHVARPPSDGLVARAWGAPIDESLSGAAGAAAFRVLRSGGTNAAEVRWMAVLAGYPWPIERAELERTAPDTLAESLLTVARSHADLDLGLVRAREASVDQWVLLVGARRGELPAFPREPDTGTTLSFPGLSVQATSPSGRALRGVDALTVDEPGEWLVSLTDAAGEVARFPLYADGETPRTAPVSASASEPGADPEDALLAHLDALDRWYGRGPPEHDRALDAVARARLRDLLADRPVPAAEPQLAAAGYFSGTAGECRGATVADCLDAMWWSHSGHAALARPWATVGYAIAPDGAGLAISLTVAASPPPAW